MSGEWKMRRITAREHPQLWHFQTDQRNGYYKTACGLNFGIGAATNMEMITKLTGLREDDFIELVDAFRELAGVEIDEPPKGIVDFTIMMFAAGAILSQK
jgi:hypothetical protein